MAKVEEVITGQRLLLDTLREKLPSDFVHGLETTLQTLSGAIATLQASKLTLNEAQSLFKIKEAEQPFTLPTDRASPGSRRTQYDPHDC